MGLFKKKVKNQDINSNEVEILELNEEYEEKESSSVSNGNDNKVFLVIIAVLVLVVFFLPTITSYVSRNSMFTYNRVVDDVTGTHTVDGMLEINNEEGSITAKGVKFYNPSKSTKNLIQIVYLPESNVKNLDDLNIYVELYNNKKNIIYRELFVVDSLERKVQGNYKLQLNDKIYTESAFVKITVIKEDDFKGKGDSLVCSKNYEDGNYKVDEKIVYNLSDRGLVSYDVSRSAKVIDSSLESDNKFSSQFANEANKLSKFGIDVNSSDNLISYSVDVRKFESNNNYTLLYNLGSVSRQIKLGEEAKGWSCK